MHWTEVLVRAFLNLVESPTRTRSMRALSALRERAIACLDASTFDLNMTSGHLACHDCKHTLHIGAVMHGPDDKPYGFGHGLFSPDDLSKLIEAFIAIHLQHQIEVIAEQDFDMRDWSGYDSLWPMPRVPEAMAKCRSIAVGPITLRIEAFEGPPE